MPPIDPRELLPTEKPSTNVPDPGFRFDIRPGQFGGLTARGEEQFGEGAFQAGQHWGQIAADDVGNQYTAAANKILHGDPNATITNPDGTTSPDLGYTGLKGEEALKQRASYQQKLDKLYNDARSKLLTPDQQKTFDDTTKIYRQRLAGAMGTHADQQGTVYAVETNKATIRNKAQDIAAYPNDEDHFLHSTSDMMNAAAKMAEAQGFQKNSPVWEEHVNGAKAAAAEARIYSIGAKDAGKAAEMADHYKDVLGTHYGPIADHFRTRAETEGAVGGGINLFNELNSAPSAGSSPLAPTGDAKEAVRHFEGLITTPKKDTDGKLRVGYGSDTITLPDGMVKPVTADTVVTKEDAERDLSRRVADTQTGISAKIGADVWGALPATTKASLTSVAYNYGSLPDTVAAVARSKDPAAISDAIRALSPHNNGINAGRRFSEAGNAAIPTDDEGKPSLAAPPDLKDQPPETPTAKLSRITEEGMRRIEQMNLPPKQTEQMIRAFRDQVSMHELAINLQEKVKKDNNESAMDEYVKGMAPGQPVSPDIVTRITADPRLTPQTREHLIEAAKRHSANDVEDATQAYGPAFWDTYKKVVAPTNDPTRIADPTALLAHAGPGGDLTLAGVRKLQETMGAAQRSVSDHSVAQAQGSLMQYAKNKLSFEQDLGPIKLRDPKGEAIFNGKFIPQFLSSYDQHTKGGKDPWAFLTQENVDKMIQGMRSPSEMARDKLAATGEAPPNSEAPGTPLPPAPEGIKQGAWNDVIQQTPILPGGQPASHQQWAQAIQLLKDNPTPQMMASFDRWGVKAGYQAKDILQKLGVPVPEGAATATSAPAGAAAPTTVPASGAPAPQPAAPVPAESAPTRGEPEQHKVERETRHAAIQEGLLAISEGRSPRFERAPESAGITWKDIGSAIGRVAGPALNAVASAQSAGAQPLSDEDVQAARKRSAEADRLELRRQISDVDKKEKEIKKLPENDPRRISQQEILAKQRDWLQEQMGDGH